MLDFEKLIVIGNSPASYTAAIYASLSLLEPLIISGPVPKSQPVQTEEIRNSSSFSGKIQSCEMTERAKFQAQNLGIRISTESVVDVDTASLPFHVLTASNKVYAANCLIIATSCEPKLLNLESEQNLIGKGISTCAIYDGLLYYQKDVVVIGGSSAAVIDTLYLSKIVRQVVLICKGRRLSCEKMLKTKLLESENIKILYNTKVTSYVTQTIKNKLLLFAVQIEHKRRKLQLRTDGVFLAIGTKPQTNAFKTVKKNSSGYIITKPNSARTNVRGIFASGDVVSSNYKQAIAATGFGCRAAIEAKEFLCT